MSYNPTVPKRIMSSDPVGNNTLHEYEHNPLSGSKKTLPGLGILQFLTASSQVTVQPGNWVAVFVNQATPGFVGVKPTNAISVPTAPGANVVPCSPYGWTVFCVGANPFLTPDASGKTAIYLIPDSGTQTTVPSTAD